MHAAVHVHQVSKTYSGPNLPAWGVKAPRSTSALDQTAPALDRVSFSVPEGEIFALCGPAGSGKTTLIRLLAARLQPDAGQVRIFGYDARRQPEHVQRQTNRVSVEASFFKGLSPRDNLRQTVYPASGDPQAEIANLLLRLGLSEAEQAAPMEALSRQQQQLVSIARAVLSRPRLLLLDAPVAGLDLFACYRVRCVLAGLRDDYGVTIVFTARQHWEAESLADRIAFLSDGRLAAIQPAAVETVFQPGWAAVSTTCEV